VGFGACFDGLAVCEGVFDGVIQGAREAEGVAAPCDGLGETFGRLFKLYESEKPYAVSSAFTETMIMNDPFTEYDLTAGNGFLGIKQV
jgi:hypothetical protein